MKIKRVNIMKIQNCINMSPAIIIQGQMPVAINVVVGKECVI